ncbi:MAG: hypothetical protein RRZ68_07325, partial [Oscillospiraceae bacterium]
KKNIVLAAMNVTLTRVNQILEREINVHLNLIANNKNIIFVTSDNFRTENKMAIIDDILAGIKKGKAKIKVLEDRTAAIEYALEIAKDEDTVLLAGKGHETYQISNNGKEHYDEREVVENALKGLN